MSDNSLNNLAMFGELEDSPDDRMVVRIIGHVLGTAEGWCHYSGLAVFFSVFQTTHPLLVKLCVGIKPKHLALGLDFYTGEIKIMESEKGMIPVVHHTLQLHELLPKLGS